MNKPQFGYLWGMSTDPIGRVISAVENFLYHNWISEREGITGNKYIIHHYCNGSYWHPMWAKWDAFYRCKLRFPYLLDKLNNYD